MSHPIMLELQLHEYLRERLIKEYPDADEVCLADTLEGLTTLHEKVTALIRSQQDDRPMIDGLKARIGEMQERLKRFETRVDIKKDLIRVVMERAGIKKIEEPDFTASIRPKAPCVMIINESNVPEDYWRPQPPKLDKQLLLRDLKKSMPVPGAVLDNGGSSLSVRVR